MNHYSPVALVGDGAVCWETTEPTKEADMDETTDAQKQQEQTRWDFYADMDAWDHEYDDPYATDGDDNEEKN